MQEHEPAIKAVTQTGQEVERTVGKQGGDTDDVKRNVAAATHKWKSVRDKLVTKRNNTQMKLKQMVQFVSKTDELENWISQTTPTVTASGTVPSEPEDIKKQLEQIQVCIIYFFVL